MSSRVEVGGLSVDRRLAELIQDEVAPGTGIAPEDFWQSLRAIVEDLEPENRRLLDQRDAIQGQVDAWHRQRKGKTIDPDAYRAFLTEIGYLLPEGNDFEVTTENVDPEIASVAGPQLVVPVDNARYALNAANARWGSLYDALYGTDVIGEEDNAQKGTGYNAVRGARVIAYAEEFLDRHVGLQRGSYSEVVRFALEDAGGRKRLVATLTDGTETRLADAGQFVGYLLREGELRSVLLRNHGLHVEIQIDRNHAIGSRHPAGVKDVLLESAVTTIQDCEDSVAAVDAEDKVRVYRNWAGLMKGTLEATFEKGGRTTTRTLCRDKTFTAAGGGTLTTAGGTLTLAGRSLMLIRNVGIHMVTDAVTTKDGRRIPEGFLDAMVTSLAAVHDVKQLGTLQNSRTGSIYIVKPKQHGPEEIAATVELFGRVEDALGLAPNTVKIGIMDEERRTTVNLKECIRRAKDRVVFINTGFLDRTGDELHTVIEAGATVPKPQIKNAAWLSAYEDWNVDVGIETGLPGRGQIGKGMWTMPDRMEQMVAAKIAHPQAGASTAWVPSPAAATLHAMHYHEVDVPARQQELKSRRRASLEEILTPALLGDRRLDNEDVRRELENNAQGILGYVVRWVDRGIGCSKVADVYDVGLMEDRATLRISSQHIGNWLYHGVVTKGQVIGAFEKMAAIVDRQNSADPAYRKMTADLQESHAYQAALELVFQGRTEPNGYTERVLTERRRRVKSSA